MLRTCLPSVLLLIVWVCTFGVVFWIVDILPQKAGQDRTLTQMCGEILESIWWAFVTLATVGYVWCLSRVNNIYSVSEDSTR